MKKDLYVLIAFLHRKKAIVRTISLILSLTISFYVIPSTIFAEIEENISENTTSSIEADKDSTSTDIADKTAHDTIGSSTEILYEITELREESAKHFRLTDGTYIAAQYNYPVHYVDENGSWEDIDNSLAEAGDEYSSANARIKFVKKTTGNAEIFTLHDGNTKISMSLTGASRGISGEVTNGTDAEEETELQKMLNLEKISSSIIYKDILDDLDLEYIATGMNVKENIIIKEKKTTYSYNFELKLNGLTATVNSLGDVEIFNESGALKYVIPAPVVYDSAGEYAPANSASYSLTHKNGKKYILTVSVSEEWANAEERVFPITVDPSLVASHSSIIDVNVSSENTELRSENDTVLYVTPQRLIHWKCTSLPAIPASARITSASITMKRLAGSYGVYVGAYEILTDWDNTLTWQKYSSTTNPEGKISNQVLDYRFIESESYYTWDITSLVKKWYAGANYGVALNTVPGFTTAISFASNENTGVDDEGFSYKPVLTVMYQDTKGLESYWTYSSHNVGKTGNGSINLATGNLTFTIPTLTATDSIFGYTPTLVYNSALANKEYTLAYACVANTSSYMPYGFKLNLNETIVPKQNGAHYIYADADGTEHEFRTYSIDTDGNGLTEYVIMDTDGLGMKLSFRQDGYATIVDRNNFKKIFKTVSGGVDESNGYYLCGMEDSAGNNLIFTFDNSLKPTAIKLLPAEMTTEIELLTFVYTNSGKLCAVYNPSSKDSVILRYSEVYDSDTYTVNTCNYLRLVEYCYGYNEPGNQTVEQDVYMYADDVSNTYVPSFLKLNYEYDAEGKLTSASNLMTDQKVKYTWSGDSVVKISEYQGETVGQEIGISYANEYTQLKSTGNDEILNTSDDQITRYIIDAYGRTISSYAFSASDGMIYGATFGSYDNSNSSKNSVKERASIGGTSVNYLLNSSFEYGTAYWVKEGSVAVYNPSKLDSSYSRVLRLYPAIGSTASVSQKLQLESGTYTFSMINACVNCENALGTFSVISVDTNAVLFSDNIPLSTASVLNDRTYSATFTLMDDAFITLEIKIINTTDATSSALAEIDSLMLEKGVGMSKYSLIDFGSFERTVYDGNNLVNINNAMYWSDENNNLVTTYKRDPIFDDSLKISNTDFGVHYVKQTIFPINTTPSSATSAINYANTINKSFLVSGYGLSSTAVKRGCFRIRVEAIYHYDETNSDEAYNYYYDFSHEVRDWQFVCGIFTIGVTQDREPIPEYSYLKSIVIYLEYSEQVPGYALFDNISFVHDNNANESYTYNDNGRIERYIRGNYSEFYQYNSHGNLYRTADNYGNIVEYTYSETNVNLISSVKRYTFTYGGTTHFPYYLEYPFNAVTKTPKTITMYDYTSYGKPFTEATYILDGNGIINISEKVVTRIYTYEDTPGSKIFGALKTETDTLGITTKYFYDDMSGRLLAVLNAATCIGIMYEYNNIGQVIRMRPATYLPTEDSYNNAGESNIISYTYFSDTNNLSVINTGETNYSFLYNEFNNVSSISVGGSLLASYTYGENNGKLYEILYGNGLRVRYVYNELECLEEIWYNEDTEAAYLYEYTTDGNIYKIIDNVNDRVIVYRYDSKGNVISCDEYAGDTSARDTTFVNIFYTDDYLVDTIQRGLLATYSYQSQFSYDEQRRLSSEAISGTRINGEIEYAYDVYDRTSTVTKSFGTTASTANTFINDISCTYKSDENNTSTLVEMYTSSVNNGTPISYMYTYNNNGNITKITYSTGEEIRYVYDNVGQLIREDNTLLSETYVYTYDSAGNISTKKKYTLTAAGLEPSSLKSINTYSYTDSNWGDLLTSFNGTAITYDEIGNSLSYYNGTSYTFTWRGRELVGATKGNTTYSFAYNDQGQRISKTVGNVTTNYYYDGDLLIAEKTLTLTLIYIYDANGSPIGFARCVEGNAAELYYYEKNLQGDIVAVYDASGNKRVSYLYDAWGNMKIYYHNTSTLPMLTMNHITYRGYYYDSDLGLYYLQSRYYDSNTCRFINADGYVSTGQGVLGYNMFAYCNNNPVNYVDHSGENPIAIIGLIVIGIVLVATLTSCSNESMDEKREQAIEAAERAEMDYKENSNTEDIPTLNIIIDTKDYMDSVDISTRKYYYDRLYERYQNEAAELGVEDNLMSKFHIKWELSIHVLGCILHHKSAYKAHLNFDDTIWSMLERI